MNGLIKKTKWYQEYKKGQAIQAEILRGMIFNSTIVDSEWLKYKSFSPGEWAADYGLLYTLYRTLGSMKPNSIAEFGLGQSSKMVHQYAAWFHKNAVTYEHDAEWVRFFNEGREGDYPVNVQLMELETIQYKGVATVTYKDLRSVVKGRQFDFVLVDGPYGSDRYSRSEVLELVNGFLAERFCIIIDDTDRVGENETAQEVMNLLRQQGIAFCSREYHASKIHTLICSADLKFLTSL